MTTTRAATWVIVLSILILLIWVLVLQSKMSGRIKRIFTAFVIASPIPPVP